jgi:hypothetical protein
MSDESGKIAAMEQVISLEKVLLIHQKEHKMIHKYLNQKFLKT